MLHKGFNRLNKTFGLLNFNKFVSAARKNNKCFIRKRKISPKDIVLFELHRKHKLLQHDMFDFSKYLKGGVSITKQGFSKARLNFRAEVFKDINDFHLKNLYSTEPEIKRFHGRFLIAIDGSDIAIPTTKENIKTFGNASVKHKGKEVHQSAMASASVAYDVLNKFILDSTISGYKLNERKYAVEHIDHISEILPKESKCIYIMDRGYPGLKLIFHLIETNSEFIIRLPNITFKEEQKKMRDNDCFMEIPITKSRINAYKDTIFGEKLKSIGSIRLRFTKQTDGNNKPRYYLSNLSMDEYATEDIYQLYKLRWRIETMYNCLKNKLQLCKFSGIKPDIIKQDFYSVIFLYNLMSDCEQQQFEDEIIPYDDLMYKPNDNMAIGILKRRMIELIMEEDSHKRSKIFLEVVKEIQSNLIKIEENRGYVRAQVKHIRESKNGYKPSF